MTLCVVSMDWLDLDSLKLPHKVVHSNGTELTIWKRLELEGNIFYQVLLNKSKYCQLVSKEELIDILEQYKRGKENDSK